MCHYAGGYLFDSCSWDGEVIATGEAAADNSFITITWGVLQLHSTFTTLPSLALTVAPCSRSDPGAMCVSCTQTGAGDDRAWMWTNLPCEPGMDYEDGR